MTPYDSLLHEGVAGAPPPPSALAEAPRRELSKGDRLYRAGDPADALFLITEGLLKLGIDVATGKERIFGLAGPGDAIGGLTPEQARYRENAVAVSPRVVVRAVALADAPSDLSDELFRAADMHMVRLRAALEDSELPVPARLARTLLRLGERFGQVSDDGTVRITLPLTHENFAAMVGAARETTTALLSEMRAAGVVQGTRGRYAFDRVRLRDYAAERARG